MNAQKVRMIRQVLEFGVPSLGEEDLKQTKENHLQEEKDVNGHLCSWRWSNRSSSEHPFGHM